MGTDSCSASRDALLPSKGCAGSTGCDPPPAPHQRWSCPSRGLGEYLAQGWEPPRGRPQQQQQPRWLSHCLANLEAGAAPQERPLCCLSWGLDPFFPSVSLNHTRCPHSDQRALAALMVAVDAASCTWPIITELAMSFGQTPALQLGLAGLACACLQH